MTRVGFIGLGIMGKPMARNLAPAAGTLFVYDTAPEAIDAAREFGAEASTPAAIAAACRIVFLSLPNASVVETVLFGKDGLAAGLAPGSIVCDLSTIRPEEAQSFAARLAESAVEYVDAPVSGGESKAITGELAIMAGGSKESFTTLTPYFAAIGSQSTYFGPAGSGSMAKTINQILVGVNLLAVCEAFALAEKSGLDLQALYDAIRGGSAGSAMLDNRIGKFLSREFKAGAKISIVHKDITLVLDAARRANVPTPLTATLYDMLSSGMARGMADQDITAMITLYEWLGNVATTDLS